MRIFILLVMFSSFSPLYGEEADSLKSIWNNSSNQDSTRLKAVKNLIWKIYLNTQVDSAILYSKEYYSFATSLNDKKEMASAKNSLGSAYRIKGEYIKAIESLEECIQLNQEIGDEIGEAGALGNLGILYMGQAEYGKALKNFLHCRKVFEASGNVGGMLNAINYIGGVYIYQEEFDKANETYQEGLRIARSEKNAMMEAYLIGNIGLLKETQGELDSALFYFFKGLEMDKNLDNEHGSFTTKLNIASVYLDLKDYENSEKYYQECFKHYKEIGEKKGVSMVLNSLSLIAYEKGNIQKAKTLGEESLDLAVEVGEVGQLKSIYKHMHTVYKDLGNKAKALDMHEKFVIMKDSIRSEEDKKQVLQQAFQFKYDRKVLADSIEQADKDILAAKDLAIEKEKTANEKQKQVFLIIGILVIGLFGGFIYTRFRVISKQKNIIEKQKRVVEEKRQEAELQKEIVESKNQEIVDSINYAKRLQGAILPSEDDLKSKLENYFLLYKPKDIVAGDFYWLEEYKGWTYIAVADCTGHGVPGALVSVICSNALSKSVLEEGIEDPGKILDRTKQLVIEKFNSNDQDLRDGMDVSLAKINFKENKMFWAGANNNLWIIRENILQIKEGGRIRLEHFPQYKTNLIELKSDKQPVGKYLKSKDFETIEFDLESNDKVYMYSDGMADQFGGDGFESSKKGGKKLKTKNLKTWIAQNSHQQLKYQEMLLDESFEMWKGDLEQIDDVCLLGIKIA